jgi:hypothetical protein
MTSSSSAKKKIVEVPAAEEGGCKHHWMIEPPNGAVSVGKCKICGTSQEFRNSFEYSSWYGTKSPSAEKAKANAAAAAAAPAAKPTPGAPKS